MTGVRVGMDHGCSSSMTSSPKYWDFNDTIMWAFIAAGVLAVGVAVSAYAILSTGSVWLTIALATIGLLAYAAAIGLMAYFFVHHRWERQDWNEDWMYYFTIAALSAIAVLAFINLLMVLIMLIGICSARSKE